MDPNANPFNPGAGTPPPELVGRDPILEDTEVILERIKRGRAERSLLFVGLRGVGKTVLLREIRRRALDKGYAVEMMEAQEEHTNRRSPGPGIATPAARARCHEEDDRSGEAGTAGSAQLSRHSRGARVHARARRIGRGRAPFCRSSRARRQNYQPAGARPRYAHPQGNDLQSWSRRHRFYCPTLRSIHETNNGRPVAG
jgi:GTPase SAR1 family protein